MNQAPPYTQQQEPPAMGERRARWGYGYQDKVATERILNLLREDLKKGDTRFKGVRLADLEAGRVDDFVLVWGKAVEGNSIKWSGEATPLNCDFLETGRKKFVHTEGYRVSPQADTVTPQSISL